MLTVGTIYDETWHWFQHELVGKSYGDINELFDTFSACAGSLLYHYYAIIHDITYHMPRDEAVLLWQISDDFTKIRYCFSGDMDHIIEYDIETCKKRIVDPDT